MEDDVQISFRGVEPSAAVEDRIRERVARLRRLDDRITSCHVVVHAPHRHRHKGRLYEARIRLCRPGHELIINGEGRQDRSHEDVYVAVRDAFEAAERRLEDERERRGREPRRSSRP
jgi:ribosomal subunit interface protein